MLERVREAQKAGWIRNDENSQEVVEGLFVLVVGAALQLVKEEHAPASEAAQFKLIDIFIDNLVINA